MNSKKYSIKKTGQKLFFKYGYTAVKVEQICLESNVCKRTFYKYYDNKTSLVLSILNDFFNKENEIFLKHKNSNLSFKNKILSILEDKMKLIGTSGAKFFKEVLSLDGEINNFALCRIKDGDRDFFSFVSDEQNKGNVRKDISASLISYMLTNKLREMVYDSEIEKMIPNLSERLHCTVNILLTGLLNEDI